MYSMRKMLLLLALTLPCLAVQAAVVPHFYRVDMPVAEGQSRDEAMQQALEVMLARLGGKDVLNERAPFAKAFEDPRSLMRRMGSAEHGGIEVDFEPSQLRDLMAEARRPMLGPTRPGVMLWAVESGGLGDEFLSQDSTWAAAMNKAAAHRAVALSYPLIDLQDRAAVSEASIVEAERATLVEATERYEASAALALHVREAGDGWALNWHLWLNDQAHSGRITADTPEQAADELMLTVANHVFSQYAVPAARAGDSSKWVIVVDSVQGLDAFASLQRTLQQLGSQVAPQLLGISGSQVRLSFEFPGSEEQLVRLLALDQRLIRTDPPAPPVPRPQPVAQPALVGAELGGIEGGEALDEVAEEPVAPTAEPPAPAANTLYFRWR